MEHVADTFYARWTGRSANRHFRVGLARRSLMAREADRRRARRGGRPGLEHVADTFMRDGQVACQSAFPGSALARRSLMAREV